MLKMKDKELKQMLMDLRYDELPPKEHEVYYIKEDGILFTIDAPTDINKAAIFELFISDKEVNESGMSPLEYYDVRINEFTAELYHNYSKKIENKLMNQLDKALDVTQKKFKGNMGGEVMYKPMKAGTTEDTFYIQFLFKYGHKHKKATVTASIAQERSTLKSIYKDLVESLDKVFEAVKVWVANCNAKVKKNEESKKG